MKGLNGSVGVTSGMVFCGLLGSSGTRREFSVLGDTVNLSARLMQAAGSSSEHGNFYLYCLLLSKGVGILCDRATRLSCKNERRFIFGALPELKVKGKAEPVSVYCPYLSPFYSIAKPFTLLNRVHQGTSYSFGGDNFDPYVPESVSFTLTGRSTEEAIMLASMKKVFESAPDNFPTCTTCNRVTLNANIRHEKENPTKVHNIFIVTGINYFLL